MDDLFKTLDAEESHGHKGMDAENQKILANAEHYGEDMANLEDELDELEAGINQTETHKPVFKGTMDIEKPAQKIYQAPKQAAPAANYQKTGDDSSFFRTMYSRQKQREQEKAFTYHVMNKDDTEKQAYELDLVENKAQFYFIDVQEDFLNKSRLLVFGKVKVKGRDPVSCCMVVHNMERRYFFFKKENENIVKFFN